MNHPTTVQKIALLLDKLGMLVASASCALIFVFVLSDVFFRAIGRPIYFAGEYSEFLMAWLIFFALGEITRDRAHLKVDFLTQHLPASAQVIVNIFADLFFMVLYVGIALWITSLLVWSSYSDNLRSQGLMLTPLFVPQLGMTAGLTICFFRTLVDLYTAIADLSSGRRRTVRTERSK